MKKRVNVKIGRHCYGVLSVTPPIYRTAMGIELTESDIQRCLWAKAVVEEILPDGTIVPLTLSNYDKDNGAGPTLDKDVKIVEAVTRIDNPSKEEVKVEEKVAPQTTAAPKEEAVKVEVKGEVKVEESGEEQVEAPAADLSNNSKKYYNNKKK